MLRCKLDRTTILFESQNSILSVDFLLDLLGGDTDFHVPAVLVLCFQNQLRVHDDTSG